MAFFWLITRTFFLFGRIIQGVGFLMHIITSFIYCINLGIKTTCLIVLFSVLFAARPRTDREHPSLRLVRIIAFSAPRVPPGCPHCLRRPTLARFNARTVTGQKYHYPSFVTVLPFGARRPGKAVLFLNVLQISWQADGTTPLVLFAVDRSLSSFRSWRQFTGRSICMECNWNAAYEIVIEHF
jgi:hypothetical protein